MMKVSVWKCLTVNTLYSLRLACYTFAQSYDLSLSCFDSDDDDVCFTSVSGFVFLRFFAPAILNPKLFQMRNEHPVSEESNCKFSHFVIVRKL